VFDLAWNQVYRRYMDKLEGADVKELAIHHRVSRLNYSRRCAEASAVQAHMKQGIPLAPGIGYVIRDARKWGGRSSKDKPRSLMLDIIDGCLRRLGRRQPLFLNAIPRSLQLGTYYRYKIEVEESLRGTGTPHEFTGKYIYLTAFLRGSSRFKYLF